MRCRCKMRLFFFVILIFVNKAPLTVCLLQKPSAGLPFFGFPRRKKRHPLFSECHFCYSRMRFDLWRRSAFAHSKDQAFMQLWGSA